MSSAVVRNGIVAVVALLAAVTGLLCLLWWFAVPSPVALRERRPIEHPRPRAAKVIKAVNIEGSFAGYDGIPSKIKGQWPQFRGVDFDNVCRETVSLAESWDDNGPPLVWSVDLGEGYAGPAVSGGRVYVLDYDEKEGGDALRCFSLDDGREIWRRWYKLKLKRNHGMSRTVPAVSDGYVVTMGPKCHVMCVDADTGNFRWGLDLAREFGTTVPMWYTGQCPLIDDGVAVIAPGGKALMIGLDCGSGEVLWQTPNPNEWEMSHSSIVPMTLGGKRMYVYCAIGAMVGVSASGEDRGTLLWEATEWDHSVVAPTPVDLRDGRIFVTAGYGVGSMMFKVTRKKGVFSADSLYALDRKIFACEQHTPIYYGGFLYSVLPKDAGELKRQLACMDPEGRLVWTSGKEHRFGMGPFLIADGKIFVMNDDGVLTMARTGGTGYEKLAEAQILHGRESWGPLALVGGRLIARDFKRMVCLDLRKR